MFPVPPPSVHDIGSGEADAHLKFVSKLLLYPGCHLRLYFIHGQKHVILQVDDLGEHHDLLTDIICEFWWAPSVRNESKFCYVEGNTRLLEKMANELEGLWAKEHSSKEKKCMNQKTRIVPQAYFGELFVKSLRMFYTQLDYSGRGFGIGEIRPDRSHGVDVEWVNDGIRQVSVQYSILLGA